MMSTGLSNILMAEAINEYQVMPCWRQALMTIPNGCLLLTMVWHSMLQRPKL